MVKSGSRRRRTDTGTSRSITPAKAPHFFKIISSSAAKHSKLMIPRKFVSKYGENLPDLVRLMVPSGAVWPVELVKSNGDILFCNGWKAFTEYYHVKFGHFLVFRYDGNSHFYVLVFDTSAVEIEYPYGSTHGGQSSADKADNSVEILEDFPSYQTMKKIYERDENENDVSTEIMDVPVPKFPSHETVRTNLKCEMENTSSSLQECLWEDNGLKHPNPSDLKLKPHRLTREIKKNCKGGTSIAPRQLKSKQSVTATGKFRALARARALKSENPVFVISMPPSYVSNRNIMYIPADFAKKHLRGRQNRVTLRVPDGRIWSVRCYWIRISGRRALGWVSFAKDNNLKVGDVCVFEMIKGAAETLFNVTIFRE